MPEFNIPDQPFADLTRLTTNEVLQLVGSPAARTRADILVGRGTGPIGDDSAPVRIAVAFSVILRKLGIAVPVGSVTTFAEALCIVGIDRRESVYWAGRSVLLRRPEDQDLYDRAFNAFWFAVVASSDTETMTQNITVELDDDDDEDTDEPEGDEDDGPDDGESISVRFSATETLRHKDFAEYTPEEFLEARTAMSALRFVGSPRRSRRRQPVVGKRTTAHTRPAPYRSRRFADRWVGHPSLLHRTVDETPADCAHLRRQRFDGGLRPGARAVLPGCGGRSRPGRSIRAWNPTDPNHP